VSNKFDRHGVRRAVRLAGFAIGLTVASFAGASNASAAPVCPEGAGQTVVVDDQGVSQVACVAQAAPAPAANVGESRSFASRTEALPETGTGTTVSLLLGTALVAAGVSASLAARRRNNTD
jgi:LPXTG-motif cell wall-anchored protein